MNGLKVVTMSLLLFSPLLGQNYPKKEAVSYDDLIKRLSYQTPTDQRQAQLSGAHFDTVEVVRQEEAAEPVRTAADRRGGVEMFGYSLFARGGTTLEIPQNLAVPDDYKLGPGDNITVSLWGRVEQEFSLTVDRQGAVFIPKVGEIAVWGLTLQQAERRIRERLQSVFSDFDLAVSLGKLKSIQVFVFGEVKYPGSYTVNSLATMFSALYQAGGPTDRGSLRRIKLMRSGTETAVVDLYQFLLFGNNVAGVSLQAGDVIFVDVVGKRVKITGAIKRPAIYEIGGDETIADLIELAGGSLPSAYLDKVRVDRITADDAWKVIDLNLADPTAQARAFVMEDGDEVFVESVYSLKQDVIYLEGRFRHPGLYQYRDGLTIADLFKEGYDLEEQAYRARIDILRCENGYDTSLVSVDPKDVVAGQTNVTLKAGDRLIAYSRDDVLPRKQVSIYGVVTRPGEYPYYEGMKISDLVFHAGNLKQSAYALRVELARIKDDGQKEIIYASLDDRKQDVLLQPNDKVFVRQVAGWEEKDMVTIEGEVMFPGRYVITSEMSSLYSLIQRAGGLTNEAFSAGTVFTRSSIVSDLKRRGVDELITRSAVRNTKDTAAVRLDSALMLRDNSMSNRIVVYLEELLKRKGGKYDVKLADGDEIFVPRKPAGIQVLGAVPSASTITYQPGKKTGHYIKRAGGFLQSADKKHLQLIRADGTIVSGRAANSRTVGLGDAIFVPTQVNKSHDWWKVLTSTASVIASITTTAFIVSRL